MAVRRGTGPTTRFVFGSSPAAAGLYAVEETAGRSCDSSEEDSGAGVCRADRFSHGDDVGMHDRVRVLNRKQDAYSVEGFGRT